MKFGPLSQELYRVRKISTRQIVFLAICMLSAMGVILARLFELTVVRGAEFRERADENRIFIRPVRAQRGVILARKGEALTRNVPIVKMIDLPGDDVGEVEIEDVGRSYPYKALFSHSVGYVGEVSEQDINASDQLSFGEVIGKTGLEKQYDAQLRGVDGSQLVEVDANGNLVRIVGEQLPISGENLQTTLSVELQKQAVEALGNRRGTVVALDPVDGSVLALASNPGFDPNVFQPASDKVQGASLRQLEEPMTNDHEVQRLLTDTVNRPLFNRAISGEYPPGSIFKLVTAMAGLEEGNVTALTTVDDTGEIKIGDYRYGNWYFDQYGRTEGLIGLTRAIARSNDIFFYKVGEWVGPDRLAEYAKKFGLGTETGVDIPGEADGLIPNPSWKLRQIGERWFLGDTYHTAIGQGDVLITPIQGAAMASAIVSGKWCTPHVAKNDHSICRDIGLTDEYYALVMEGMVGVCSSGGTAFPFFDWNAKGAPATVACKTGTAQHGGEKTKPHAWIVVAGPIIMPSEPEGGTGEQGHQLDMESEKRIVLLVMLEEAGEGSAEAGPVAKRILERWFEE